MPRPASAKRCAPLPSSTPRTPAGRASCSATSESPGRCARTSRATKPNGPSNWDERLQAGETVALLTDAGVPTISDPGLSAVRAALLAGAVVTGVPGPSAVTLAAALSGLPADRFAFEGFLPRRGGALGERLDSLAAEPRTMVFFCAPGRLAADLAALAGALGAGRECAVCRELTKLHEEVWRGTLDEAARHWAESPAAGRSHPGGRRGAGESARPGRGRGPGRGDGGRGRLGVGGVPGRGRGTGDPPPRPLRSGHRPPPGRGGMSPAQRLRPMRSIT